MNIYFSGIGGVGIGPLAQISLDAGHSVFGSDLQASPLTEQLEALGAKVTIGQDGSFLEEINKNHALDWFVHTAALPPTHPELQLAKKLGIRTAKRDELLAELLKVHKLKLLAVAGTHGKTTTTGMLVWAFKQLGVPVSYSVGTTLSFGKSGEFNPSSQYFVYECDEFDRNFLHFYPEMSLITSIDYDHPDTYPTPESYKQAFIQYLGQSQQSIIWQRDIDFIGGTEQAAKLAPNSSIKVMPGTASLPNNIAGLHNRQNAALVIEALVSLNLASEKKAKEILASFPGTDRRFQQLLPGLYSDYGHHPVEIAATLQLASEISSHVVLVYQPHQNIRQHEIQGLYVDSVFEKAYEIYWLPTYLSREDPLLEVLTPKQLSAGLSRPKLHFGELNDELWAKICQATAAGRLVICMGAGTIDGWLRNMISSHQTQEVLGSEDRR